MSVTVALGNVAPVDYLTDDNGLKTKYAYPGLVTVTNVNLVEEGLFAQMRDVVNLWAQKSDAPPSWVTCPEAPGLEAALRDHFKTGAPPEDGVLIELPEGHDAVASRVQVASGLDVPADVSETVEVPAEAPATPAEG